MISLGFRVLFCSSGFVCGGLGIRSHLKNKSEGDHVSGFDVGFFKLGKKGHRITNFLNNVGISPQLTQNLTLKTFSMSRLIRGALGLVDPRPNLDPKLCTVLFGKKFPNCIGLASGFDKSGIAIDGLLDLGFGSVEIGTICLSETEEQSNCKGRNRIILLKQDKAIVDQTDVHTDRIENVVERISHFQVNKRKRFEQMKMMGREPEGSAVGLLGINISVDFRENICDNETLKKQFEMMYDSVDYIVLNVTLTEENNIQNFKNLIQNNIKNLRLVKENKKLPILLKISPDLSNDEKKVIAEITFKENVDGLVIANSCIKKLPLKLKSTKKNEEGGLSGDPIMESSTSLIGEMYSLTNGKVPIIGVGGIRDGRDAYRKIRQGASMVQMYSSLIFRGYEVPSKVKDELHEILLQEGMDNIQQAIGLDFPKITKSKKR